MQRCFPLMRLTEPLPDESRLLRGVSLSPQDLGEGTRGHISAANIHEYSTPERIVFSTRSGSSWSAENDRFLLDLNTCTRNDVSLSVIMDTRPV